MGNSTSPPPSRLDSKGKVYVVDCYNNRVQKFDAAGKFLMTWGAKDAEQASLSFRKESRRTARTTFTLPIRITTESRNSVRTASSLPDGEVAAAAGDSCGFPDAIAVDGEGTVYVADTMNSRIQVFKP